MLEKLLTTLRLKLGSLPGLLDKVKQTRQGSSLNEKPTLSPNTSERQQSRSRPNRIEWMKRHKEKRALIVIAVIALAFVAGSAARYGLKQLREHLSQHSSDSMPASSPAAPAGTASSPTDDFAQQALTAHNNVRAQYGASALSYDTDLENGAKQWAKACHWKHSKGSLGLNGGRYGENLASNAPAANYTVQDAVDAWVAEVAHYDYFDPTFDEATGHFTQVVWKGTQKVGCARVECDLDVFSSGQWPAAFVVCEYAPPGNVQGQFAANVGSKAP